ncbi:N-acetylaspartate synthetase isoform X2 [Protopterus annectens]|uniref:N-acetylaspartate synthetase isoform X2 n=1 Tax=Protopterus annectens TaxID=7888 RepID=UPI001CF96B50|nr:N-acetylaspartate synthetase isoform X2 [Protopterus annectens]
MHCLSLKMVCETKIVADDHKSIPGTKNESVITSSLMWPPLSSHPSDMEDSMRSDKVYIREFHPYDQDAAQRIFYEGLKERIPNTAFRGLKQQPKALILYVVLTRSCFWVAVLNGKVVGIVAAKGNEEENNVELCRMSVDSSYRGKGIAKALGHKVMEFAILNSYSSIVLGTTAVKMAAHKLYESLGFAHMGVIENYSLPAMDNTILERMFFQLRYHRYSLQLHEE